MILSIILAVSLAAQPDLSVRPIPPNFNFQLTQADIANRRTTEIALVTTTALLLVLEFVIMQQRDKGNLQPTISEVMAQWGNKYGTLPWMAGVMAGHWFWNQPGSYDSDRSTRSNAMMLGWITGMVVAWDITDHRGTMRYRAPLLLGGGILAGHFLWPQHN